MLSQKSVKTPNFVTFPNQNLLIVLKHTLQFYKYQGTGNDFVLIDNRDGNFKPTQRQIQHLCQRKFGIGSDGLMLIQASTDESVSFVLDFFNPDGSKSFCGNGSRCAVAFAKHLGMIDNECNFKAIDGIHAAKISADGIVSIKMGEVGAMRNYGEGYFLNTGSPHVVLEVSDLDKYNVVTEGSKIRYSADFAPAGTNVNFVERAGDVFKVRTYERGVENETLSCGTGVTAVAIAMHKKYELTNKVQISTPGGDLKVLLEAYNDGYTNIWLKGPAVQVYIGAITL